MNLPLTCIAGMAVVALMILYRSPRTVERIGCKLIAWSKGEYAKHAVRKRQYILELQAHGLQETEESALIEREVEL